MEERRGRGEEKRTMGKYSGAERMGIQGQAIVHQIEPTMRNNPLNEPTKFIIITYPAYLPLATPLETIQLLQK
jgi:hypothetical protein